MQFVAVITAKYRETAPHGVGLDPPLTISDGDTRVQWVNDHLFGIINPNAIIVYIAYIM